MSKFLDCIKPKPCEPEEKEQPTPATDPFDLCVIDYALHWDGKRASVERTKVTEDGTYTQITVENGCITGFGYAPEPVYTPPFCAANPEPCQEGQGGGINVSPSMGNLISQTPEGLFAKVYAVSDGSLDVSGSGTQTDPLRFSASAEEGSAGDKVVGSDVIMVQSMGEGVSTVSMQPSGVAAGDYDWTSILSIDQYGRVIRAEENDEPPIRVGTGLESMLDGKTTVISHPVIGFSETNPVNIGTARLSFNSSGHLTRADKVHNVDAKTYNIGDGSITVNEMGLVTNIDEGKETSTYAMPDEGRGISTYAMPDEEPEYTFIRDMYRIVSDGKGFTMESYGNPLSLNYQGDTVSMTLPGYVESTAQIQINGGGEWDYNPGNGQLLIRVDDDYRGVITVTLRW